jgi:hypothetical protein
MVSTSHQLASDILASQSKALEALTNMYELAVQMPDNKAAAINFDTAVVLGKQAERVIAAAEHLDRIQNRGGVGA